MNGLLGLEFSGVWLFRVWFLVFRLGGLEFLGLGCLVFLMVLRNLEV